MEYLILYLVILFFGLGYIFLKKEIFLKIIFIILTLFSGLRYKVGADYEGYEFIFSLLSSDIENYEIIRLEKGYYLLIKMINLISGTQQLVFLIMAIISNYLIYKFIIESSRDKILSVFIFFLVGPYYSSGFNGIRQYLAISLFLYSLKYLKNRKIFKYFFFIFLGFLFHKSCILLLPLYLILNLKYSLKGKIFILILSSFVDYKLLPTILNIFNYDIYNSIVIYRVNSNFYFLLLFLIFSIFILLYNEKNKSLNKIEENINFYAIILLILVFFNEKIYPYLNQIFLRMVTYFLFYYIIIIPNFIEKVFKQKKLIKNLFFILISILYIKTFLIKLPDYQYNLKLFYQKEERYLK